MWISEIDTFERCFPIVYISFDVVELIKDFRDVKAEDKDIHLTLKGFKEQYNLDDTEFKHVKIKEHKEEK